MKKNKGKIIYQQHLTEFELQAELWRRLKKISMLMRWLVRGEISAKTVDGKIAKFDLVLFNRKFEAICIIETKRWTRKELKKRRKSPKKTAQLLKYATFNIPILECGHPDQLSETVAKAKTIARHGSHD